MNEELFRKKSIDRVKSPESLNDYIRVSNPGVWLILAAVVALLAGACIWGIFGRIETETETAVFVDDGRAYCVTEDDRINDKMTVEISEKEYQITEIEKINSDKQKISIASEGLPDGVYMGRIIVESVKPISFVFN